MTARLRPMTPADLRAVTALENVLFPEDAWPLRMFASELHSGTDGRYYLVAEEAGQIVGYAGLLVPPRGAGEQADVLTMAVAEAHWSRGIGTALLTAMLAQAAEQGCDEVFLEVRADNPRAQRLYRKHGFSAIGLRRGYYQPSGTDAIVMSRPVGQPGPSSTASPASPVSPASTASPASPTSTATASEGSRP